MYSAAQTETDALRIVCYCSINCHKYNVTSIINTIVTVKV